MLNSSEGGESGRTKLNSSNFKSLMVRKVVLNSRCSYVNFQTLNKE